MISSTSRKKERLACCTVCGQAYDPDAETEWEMGCHSTSKSHIHYFHYIEKEKSLLKILECPFTAEPVFDPLVMSCGHIASKQQLLQYLEGKKNTCPLCRKEFCASDLQKPEFMLQGVLNAIQVNCPHCEWIGNRGEIESHIKFQCPFVPVKCPNDCEEPCHRSNLECHLQNCQYEMISCPIPGCSNSCLRKDMDDHVKQCEFALVDCLQGCAEQFLRNYEDEHLEMECFERNAVCDTRFGKEVCEYIGPLCLIEQHTRLECPLRVVQCENLCGVRMCARDASSHKCIAFLQESWRNERNERLELETQFTALRVQMKKLTTTVRAYEASIEPTRMAFMPVSGMGALQKAPKNVLDILDIMEMYPDEADVLGRCCKVLGDECVTSRRNRLTLLDAGGLEMLSSVMCAHLSHTDVQREACLAILNLARSTVDTPGQDEQVVMAGGLAAILKAMNTHSFVAEIQHVGCQVISVLAIASKNKRAILDADGIKTIVLAMTTHTDNYEVQKDGCITFALMAKGHASREIIRTVGGIEAVITAMLAHSTNEGVQQYGAKTLAVIAINIASRQRLMRGGGVKAIVQAMKLHTLNLNIQRSGVAVLSTIISSNKDLVTPGLHYDEFIATMKGKIFKCFTSLFLYIRFFSEHLHGSYESLESSNLPNRNSQFLSNFQFRLGNYF